MKEYPLISVIVPVYNVSKYLRRCVDSILAQTYPNIEIVLINDGSTDNSWEICLDYQGKHSNVIAFTKENGGLSSARNCGLCMTKGQYVGFIDSDDWIASDMYENMYQLMEQNNADVVECNRLLAFNPIYANGEAEKKNKNYKNHIVDGRNNILLYYMQSSTASGSYSVCKCLFKSDIACRYRFREGKINEDMDYKYLVLSDCKKMIVSDKIGYFYFQSGNSISFGKLKKRDFDLFEAAEIIYELTNKEYDAKIRFLGLVKKVRTPFSLLSKAAFCGISEDVDKKIINDLIRKHRQNLLILLKSNMRLSRKIVSVLFAINYRFTEKLIRLYQYFGGRIS